VHDTITVEGKEFENYSDYPRSGIGTIPLRSAFANSCNSAFISQYESVNAQELAQAAAALGLGSTRTSATRRSSARSRPTATRSTTPPR
jgi:membrane peptidoglycan carboxypeptidase